MWPQLWWGRRGSDGYFGFGGMLLLESQRLYSFIMWIHGFNMKSRWFGYLFDCFCNPLVLTYVAIIASLSSSQTWLTRIFQCLCSIDYCWRYYFSLWEIRWKQQLQFNPGRHNTPNLGGCILLTGMLQVSISDVQIVSAISYFSLLVLAAVSRLW